MFHFPPFHSIPFPSTVLPELLKHLAQYRESRILDKFCHLRCLNDCIDLPDMIGSYASGTNAFLGPKVEQKNTTPLCIKSSPVDRFWCLSCLINYIDLSNMIGHLKVVPRTLWWQKSELKVLPHHTQSKEYEIIDGF